MVKAAGGSEQRRDVANLCSRPHRCTGSPAVQVVLLEPMLLVYGQDNLSKLCEIESSRRGLSERCFAGGPFLVFIS
eukprot:3875215-Amphidinium_carterae.1